MEISNTTEKLNLFELPIVEKNLVFALCGGEEVLKFCSDGKVYVRGELVDDNIKIYNSFREWFDKVS